MKKLFMNLYVVLLSLLMFSCQTKTVIQEVPISKVYHDTIIDNNNNFDTNYVILSDMDDYRSYKLVAERFNRVYDESFFDSHQVVFVKINQPGVKKYVDLQLRDLLVFDGELMITYVTPACYLAIEPDPMILLIELDKETYPSSIDSVNLNGGSDFLFRYENENDYIEVSLMKYHNQASIKLYIQGVTDRLVADYKETPETMDDYEFTIKHSDTLDIKDFSIRDGILIVDGTSYTRVYNEYEGGCLE
ncbi:hypothetical protein BN85316300 [Paracholeplasma brassicae]|uniref:Uncharacterized protein n=1 Tax=Acholeplasma brassicae TaxID=61635 RepID=U4KQD1_9MOLU|nr:hypothetical protein [Paracholeplasma brassicae]CCV66651.1 hypothetical protein BN85316300 [Paracholeplasma brassicae]